MAPVPAPIIGRYKLYKAGTERLAQYLARAADGICDVRSLTGDNRKSSKGLGEPRVKISTRHFVVLAEAIAGALSPVAVPAHVLKLTEDVIAGRQYCADWYASQPSEEGSEVDEQNKRHAHFIAILEKVLSILSSCTIQHGSRRSSDPVASTSSPELHSLRNLFAILEVEDSAVDPLGTVPVSAPSSTGPPPLVSTNADATHFDYIEEDAGGLVFEVWCLLEDLHDLRVYARDTWLAYSRGELSVLAAGIITNTAFSLMRRHVAEFDATHSDLDEYWKLLKVFNVNMVTIGKLHLVMPKETGSAPQQPRSDINPAALLCPAAALLLRHILELAMKRVFEDCLQTAEGRKCRAKIEADGNDPARWESLRYRVAHRFGETLVQHFPRIMRHATGTRVVREDGWNCDRPADEFLKGLIVICGDVAKGIPVWMVVACQTYMDIFDILGDRIDVGATTLVRCHIETAVAVRQYNAARQEYPFKYMKPSWQKHFESVISENFRFATCMAAYPKLDVADRTVPDATFGLESLPIEAILELPVMSCQMLCTLTIENACKGIAVCNDGVIVLPLAHYYTAARTYGLVPAWEDMDTVIAQNRNFVIPTANDADTYALARHYGLALGVEASKLLRNNPVDLPGFPGVMKKAKAMELTTPLFNTVAKYNARNLELPSDQIGELVLIDIADMSTANVPSGGTKSAVSERTSTPTQLLDKLKEHLIASEVQLNFDYISFFRQCVEVMASMMRSGYPNLPNRSSKKITHFYDVVDLLLREAADAVTKGTSLAPTFFSRSVGVLGKVIAQGGDSLIRAALERSSGHIPQHLRPMLPSPQDYKSEARTHLERKGFNFDGTRRDAAIYPPTSCTKELMEDIMFVRRILYAWDESCSDGSRPTPPLPAETALEVGQEIGADRWDLARSLITLQAAAEQRIR
ncbi:hypothetical protein LTR17_013873 [Elasticomyces elasticus]|nr:hypothetical protein LTR17_013873 [Elasticomyces elasticus]